MNILISLIISLSVMLVIIISTNGIGFEYESRIFIGFIIGSLSFIVSFYNIKVKSGSDIAFAAINIIKDAKEIIESNIDCGQAEFLATAEEECDEGRVDKGLWSQALVKAKGNENLRKVEYMKLRAKQLKKINS